jgi:hypothetical protein
VKGDGKKKKIESNEKILGNTIVRLLPCVLEGRAVPEDISRKLLAKARYDRLIMEAQEKIDDAQTELDDKKAEAEKELDDAWQKILDGEQELLDGEAFKEERWRQVCLKRQPFMRRLQTGKRKLRSMNRTSLTVSRNF